MSIAAALSLTSWTVALPVGGRAAGWLEASYGLQVACDSQFVINLRKKSSGPVADPFPSGG
jgi:hypothetical protein